MAPAGVSITLPKNADVRMADQMARPQAWPVSLYVRHSRTPQPACKAKKINTPIQPL